MEDKDNIVLPPPFLNLDYLYIIKSREPYLYISKEVVKIFKKYNGGFVSDVEDIKILMKVDIFRKFTFIYYEGNINYKEIYNAGFYYYGDKEKVICYKCGLIIDGFEYIDCPKNIHRKLNKNCKFVKKYIFNNLTDKYYKYRNLEVRKKTFNNIEISSINVDIITKEGFFVLDNCKIICYSCGIIVKDFKNIEFIKGVDIEKFIKYLHRRHIKSGVCKHILRINGKEEIKKDREIETKLNDSYIETLTEHYYYVLFYNFNHKTIQDIFNRLYINCKNYNKNTILREIIKEIRNNDLKECKLLLNSLNYLLDKYSGIRKMTLERFKKELEEEIKIKKLRCLDKNNTICNTPFYPNFIDPKIRSKSISNTIKSSTVDSGLFHRDDDDKNIYTCFFCNIKISINDYKDDPLKKHFNKNPCCEFLSGVLNFNLMKNFNLYKENKDEININNFIYSKEFINTKYINFNTKKTIINLMLMDIDSKKLGSDEISTSCVICFENLNNIRTSLYPCGHSFTCNKCLNNIKKIDNLCPICRINIEKTNIIYI